jgi:hypothetical protein
VSWSCDLYHRICCTQTTPSTLTPYSLSLYRERERGSKRDRREGGWEIMKRGTAWSKKGEELI